MLIQRSYSFFFIWKEKEEINQKQLLELFYLYFCIS